MYEYEGMNRIAYGEENALFIPVCPYCSRFVKADKSVKMNGMGEVSKDPNATCKKHGRVQMPFEGYL